jgi:anti-sigma B factor antagonist
MNSLATHHAGLSLTSWTRHGGCGVAVLSGQLDIVSASAVRVKLLGLLTPAASRLIVDLSAVGYADASGVAVLVGSGRRARLLGGWLRLAAPAPEVARVLSATGLDRHLAAFPTVQAAITGQRPDPGAADARTGTAGRVARTGPLQPDAVRARRAAGSPPVPARSRRLAGAEQGLLGQERAPSAGPLRPCVLPEARSDGYGAGASPAGLSPRSRPR